MGKCKTKPIQADLGIFRNISTYYGTRHNQAILGSLRNILAYP